jgi:hypothetical protein
MCLNSVSYRLQWHILLREEGRKKKKNTVGRTCIVYFLYDLLYIVDLA